MRLRSIVTTLLALGALSIASARAGVIVVAPSGAPFSSIQTAVNAAADGDIVLVKAGTYSGFAVGSTSIDVVADAGASVVIQGAVVVSQLAVTRTVTLTGLTVRGPLGTGGGLGWIPALRISDDAGAVRVQGCELIGHDGPPCSEDYFWGGSAARVMNSPNVAFARCTLIGGNGSDYGTGIGYGGYGGKGIYASASRIAVYDCDLHGGRGGSQTVACGWTGSFGLGGIGGDGALVSACPQFFVARSSFRAGDPGFAGGFPGEPAYGIYAGNNPTITTLESVFVSNPSSGGGTYPGIQFTDPGTLIALPGTGRTLTTNRVVREGASLRVALDGEPGDVVELMLADQSRFVLSSAWRGVSLLRAPKPAPVMLVGVIDATGVLDLTWPIADLGTGVQGRRVFLQAAFRDTAGITTLSTPATVVLLDAAF